MPHVGRALASSLALYLAWTAATWLLEGRLHTLLRPDATAERARYALVANLAIGTLGALWLLRVLARWRVVTSERAGFRPGRPVLAGAAAGATLGLCVLAVQRPPTWNPLVLLNAYAQVLVVSVAEVLVCWAVAGAVVESALAAHGSRRATLGAAVVASALFGLYHLAHSPPFDTWRSVAMLSVVGLVTSVFFVASRNVYGTVVFHTFLGVLGVLRALQAADRLSGFARFQLPLLLTALAAGALLVAGDLLLLRRPVPGRSRRRRAALP